MESKPATIAKKVIREIATTATSLIIWLSLCFYDNARQRRQARSTGDNDSILAVLSMYSENESRTPNALYAISLNIL